MRSHALDAARLNAGQIVLDDEWGARARPLSSPSGVVAHLMIADHTVAPPQAAVARWLDDLASRGFTLVRTGALAPRASEVFAHQGCTVEQELVLLRVDPRAGSHRTPSPIDVRPRTARTVRDLELAASIDVAAFGQRWSIDEAGIADACAATPSHRFRMLGDASYAVTGRAATSGFVQRLAVHPDHQREGFARRLMVDALEWLRRWRVTTAMVNTHVGNAPALALYASLGFTRLEQTLRVMTCPLDGSGTDSS